MKAITMIEDILAFSESKTLEFKENTKPLTQVIKTVIAFANTAGGTIVFGIKDKTKEILGIQNILLEEERLANAIADSIESLLIPDIQICSYRKRELLILSVPHMPVPYYLKSVGKERGVYVRLGSTNRMADQETIVALERLAKNISFDELPCVEAPDTVLDATKLTEAFKRMQISKTSKNYERLGIRFSKLGKSHPTYGAILLFGQDRLDWLPDSMIRCVCFQGDDRTKIIDQIDLEDDLISCLDKIIEFIERHTATSARIGRTTREDIPQFPPILVREAVSNALVHADYAMTGASIQIAVFADRVEITNPGALPYGQTLDAAMSGISRMRNRVLGKVFRQMRLIERLGSGLQRMIRVCKEQGIQQPKFEEWNNQFRVILYGSTTPLIPLESWQKLLLDTLNEQPQLKTKQIAKLWSISDRTARTRLNAMLKLGLIERIGTSPKDPHATYCLSGKQGSI